MNFGTELRTDTYAAEDKKLSGGSHGNGNLAPENTGDERRGHSCFRGEEESGEPRVGSKAPVNEKKPTL